MTRDAFYEKIVRRKLSLGLVLGAVLVTIVVVLTVLLQYYWKAIDIFPNLTEIWLFVIALPLLSAGLTLIVRGLSTPSKEGHEPNLRFCARREVPHVDMLLKDAKENGQVWVMGIDCSHWLTGFPEKIGELVRLRNLSFTFLLAADRTQSIKLAEAAKLISPQSDVTHSRSVESFNSIRSGLGNNAHKLRLGIYDLPPVHSMVVINVDTEDEQIVVDHYLYDIDPLERPSLILKRAHLSDQLRVVFDQYRKSIDHAMRKAKDQEGEPLLR